MSPYCLNEYVPQDCRTNPGLCIAMRRGSNRLETTDLCCQMRGGFSRVLLGSVPKPTHSNVLLNDSDGAVSTLVMLEVYSSLRLVVDTLGLILELKTLPKN